MAEKIIKQRQLIGTVVSRKMDKTVVVKVDRQVMHAKYHKSYASSKKYKCHDEKGIGQTGRQVVFVECRPYSKAKRWRLLKII